MHALARFAASKAAILRFDEAPDGFDGCAAAGSKACYGLDLDEHHNSAAK
jgi:hypothetical protein